ncbi:MAG TPA: cytochrome P460 family protein [Kofleriaceae bacterium]|nr:cytochrome P460 family protein [Kofleriaceae bacterium]
MSRSAARAAAWAASLAVLAASLAACGGGDGGDDAAIDAPGPAPLFPADYAATYQQVRACRNSLDHDLHRIRVLAAPEALASYMGRTTPFPAGAIVLKEEYGGNDATCAGPIVSFTVMQKLAAGSSAATLDWQWQEVSGDRRTVNEDNRSCVGCHTSCGKPPEGFDGTCTVP